MRILVTGGRNYPDREKVFVSLDRLHKEKGITCIIHGACPTGADHWADEWAKDRGVGVEAYEADWIRLGRWAGPVRNQEMIDRGKPDGVVGFSGGRGTADMLKRAGDWGIKVWLPR